MMFKSLTAAMMLASACVLSAQETSDAQQTGNAPAAENKDQEAKNANPKEEQNTPPTVKQAASIPFRSGRIYSAEISLMEPEIEDKSDFDVSGIENPAYAELIVKIDPGKGISRFDYKLSLGTAVFPCAAIAKYPDIYSMAEKNWIFKKVDSGKYYRMLFVVPSSNLSEDKLVTMNLNFELFDTRRDKVQEIKFRVLPINTNFTDPKEIRGKHQDGLYGMTFAQLNGVEEAQAEAAASSETAPAENASSGEGQK